MELADFITKRPFLYHLTDKENIKNIIRAKQLLSAVEVARLCGFPLNTSFLIERREGHVVLRSADGATYKIRDQRPISLAVLPRCLQGGMTVQEYLLLLNKRVFFWPTAERLQRHFERYALEEPIIIRVATADILNGNTPLFSRLNSGATRCNSHLGGNPPARGASTFLTSENFDLSPSKVAEVTFLNRCILPSEISVSDSPSGKWVTQKIN